MKEKTVVIEVDEQGNSSIDLQGFQGRGCSDVAEDFQAGDVVKGARNKPGLYVGGNTFRVQLRTERGGR